MLSGSSTVPSDPLLFCIAEEARLFALSVSAGRISAFQAPRGITFPVCILYADDILILCGASLSNARRVLPQFGVLQDMPDFTATDLHHAI